MKDEVLQRLIIRIFIYARILHLSMNGDGLLLHHVLLGRDEQHILVLQWDVGNFTAEYSVDVHGYHFQRAVGFSAVHHGTGCEGTLGESVGSLYQGFDGLYVATDLIHAGTEDGTFYLDHVLITRYDGVDAYRVAVGEAERREVELVDIEDGILTARLSEHADRFCVGVAGEASRITKQGAKAFVARHLIVHRTFHLTSDVDEAVVGSYNDNVAVGKFDVARQTAVLQVVVDVDVANEAVASVNFYVSERTEVAGTSGRIEGVEGGGECRQRVGSRSLHLSHDVNHYRVCRAYGQTDL